MVCDDDVIDLQLYFLPCPPVVCGGCTMYNSKYYLYCSSSWLACCFACKLKTSAGGGVLIRKPNTREGNYFMRDVTGVPLLQ